MLGEFLKANSSIASNRCIKVKTDDLRKEKDYIPVRYLDDNAREIYKKFRRFQQFQKTPLDRPITLCTFRNYIKKNHQYRKATRLTDICDYCEW